MQYRRKPEETVIAPRIALFVLLSAFLAAAVYLSPAAAFQVAAGTDSLSPAETDELNNLETEDDVDIVFTPPVIGAPGDRIGAGTRGGINLVKRIELLVPKGGGLTVSASPTVHWWLSQDFSGTVRFKIEPIDGKLPAKEVAHQVDAKSGIQSLDLAEFGLELKEGTIYIWKIVLQKSEDVAWASGLSFIERVSPKSDGGDDDQVARARALAEAGIWYDALTVLARDQRYEKQRSSLLKSAGFTFMLGQ